MSEKEVVEVKEFVCEARYTCRADPVRTNVKIKFYSSGKVELECPHYKRYDDGEEKADICRILPRECEKLSQYMLHR